MGVSFSIKVHVPEVLSALAEQKEAALEDMGLVAEGYAKRLCPVDTGNLRNSITHTTGNNAAYVGTNVYYGPYVEMGTSRTRAQPFIKPAVEDHITEYEGIARSHLGR